MSKQDAKKPDTVIDSTVRDNFTRASNEDFEKAFAKFPGIYSDVPEAEKTQNIFEEIHAETANPDFEGEDEFIVQEGSSVVIRPEGKDIYPLSSSAIPTAIVNLFLAHATQKSFEDKNLQDQLAIFLTGLDDWNPFIMEIAIDGEIEKPGRSVQEKIIADAPNLRHTLLEFMDHLSIYSDTVKVSSKMNKGEMVHTIEAYNPMDVFKMIRETIIGSGMETFESNPIDLTDMAKRAFRKSRHNPYHRKDIEEKFFETANIGRIAREILSHYGELHQKYREEIEDSADLQMDDDELLLYMPARQMANEKQARTLASVYREGAGYGMISLDELESKIRRDLKMEIRSDLALRSPH